MKIWLVNPFDPLPGESFRPGRYASMVDMLAQNGHKVTWWSSNFFHATKSYRVKIREKQGVEIILIQAPEYKENVSLKRIWSHYIFAKRFKNIAEKRQERPDIIITSCPPLSAAMTSIQVAKRLGIKCVVDIQDLWPEAFEMILPSKFGNVICWPLRRYSESIYNSADALVAVSQTYLEKALSVCEDKFKPSLVLHLGVDLSLFDTFYRSKNVHAFHKKEDGFWITYIGTIGKSYDIKTILKCARSLIASHKDIRFFIVGDGPDLSKVIKAAKKMNLENCKFTGWLSFEEMIWILKQSDVSLNAIVRKSKTSFPNKVFDYMAAGLPIINSVRGEFETLLNANKIGLQYIAENDHSLREAILYLYNHPKERKIMGVNARRIVEEKFDRNKTYLAFEKLLRDLTKC